MKRTNGLFLGMHELRSSWLAPRFLTIIALSAFAFVAAPTASAVAAAPGLALEGAIKADLATIQVKGLGGNFGFGGPKNNDAKNNGPKADKTSKSFNGKGIKKKKKGHWGWKKPRRFEERNNLFPLDMDRKRHTQFHHARHKIRKLRKILRHHPYLPYYKRHKIRTEIKRLKKIVRNYDHAYHNLP